MRLCPHGWTFHKPVLLTFPHCGLSGRDDFTLLVTETSSQQAPDWVEVSSATPGIEYFVWDKLVISYESVRRKRDSNVLFKLQAEPEHKKGTAILSLSICAFQDGNSDSPTYSIAEELPVATGQTEMRKLGPTSCDHKGACNCKTPSQVCMVHSADITDQTFLNSLGSHRSRHLTIPHKLRTQLCIKLDPPSIVVMIGEVLQVNWALMS
ncbi:hypothetical protein Bbelb_385540 [Branchiostoma belcheri]|nr:hypothetical protein Bbelb_385540 [Branchiostoma belcheri]